MVGEGGRGKRAHLVRVLGLAVLRDDPAVVGHQEAVVVRDFVRAFELGALCAESIVNSQ